jgi:hypothetical protein
MGTETASIFHRKGDNDMRSPVDRRDGLRGNTVCLKLAVLGLYRNTAGNSRGVLGDGVAVDDHYHCINHRVATFREEVENYNIYHVYNVVSSQGTMYIYKFIQVYKLFNFLTIFYLYSLIDVACGGGGGAANSLFLLPLKLRYGAAFLSFVAYVDVVVVVVAVVDVIVIVVIVLAVVGVALSLYLSLSLYSLSIYVSI